MMDLEIDVKKIKEGFSWKHLKKTLADFALRRANLFVILLMFLITIFFICLWYSCIYKPQWSEAKKQEYIKSKDKGSIFSKDFFEDIIKEYDLRKGEFQKDGESLEDIFRLKK